MITEYTCFIYFTRENFGYKTYFAEQPETLTKSKLFKRKYC